jgi:hypothetical protein
MKRGFWTTDPLQLKQSINYDYFHGRGLLTCKRCVNAEQKQPALSSAVHHRGQGLHPHLQQHPRVEGGHGAAPQPAGAERRAPPATEQFQSSYTDAADVDATVTQLR